MPEMPEEPRAQLARGLRAGNLNLIRAATRQLDPLPLDVAFEVLMLIHRHEPAHWPRAGARWLGRVALEQSDVVLEDVGVLVDALQRLDRRSAEQLRELDRRTGLRLDLGLALWPDNDRDERRRTEDGRVRPGGKALYNPPDARL
jgi:hypothetical protein